MKIIVDVFGGDNAPLEILKGCKMALENNKELELVLVGDEVIIKGILEEEKADFGRIEIINATDVIANEDHAASAVRSREGSTIVVAYKNLKERDDIGGLVSAGSSGAVLSGALLRLGRIKGVLRPAILSTFPTVKYGKVLLMDSGANADCKPEYLEQFALMANAYAKTVLGLESPRIGLLNVGIEEGKGSECVKAAFDLIKAHEELNFIGNVEAREYLSGDVDIIVAEGFAGNVLMKGTEGAALSCMKLIKNAFMTNFWTKLGALFVKKELKKVKKILNYADYGGAFFVGCQKVVCKAHGSSKAKSISIAINETYNVAKLGLVEKVKGALGLE